MAEEAPLLLQCACGQQLEVPLALARRAPALEPLCEFKDPVSVEHRKSALVAALRLLDPDFRASNSEKEKQSAAVAAVACAAAAHELLDALHAKRAERDLRVKTHKIWNGPSERAAAEAEVQDAPEHLLRLAASGDLLELLEECMGCAGVRAAKRARAEAAGAPLFSPTIATRPLAEKEVLLPHLCGAPGAAEALEAAENGPLRERAVARRASEEAAAARTEATLALARALGVCVRSKSSKEGAVLVALKERAKLETLIMVESAKLGPPAAAACANGTSLRLAAFYDAVRRARAPYAVVAKVLASIGAMLPEAADLEAFKNPCGCGNKARAAEWALPRGGAPIVWLRHGTADEEDADLARVLALVERERLTKLVSTPELTCFSCLSEIEKRNYTANWALTKGRW